MRLRAVLLSMALWMGCHPRIYDDFTSPNCDVVAMPSGAVSFSPQEVLDAITPDRVRGVAVWRSNPTARLPFDMRWRSQPAGESRVERFDKCFLRGEPALVFRADLVMDGTIGDWPISGVFEGVEIRAYEPTREDTPYGSYLPGSISVDPRFTAFGEEAARSPVPWESPRWQMGAPWRSRSLGVAAGQTRLVRDSKKGETSFMTSNMTGFVFQEVVVDRPDW